MIFINVINSVVVEEIQFIINYEIIVDLDFINVFEGFEKFFEVWFVLSVKIFFFGVKENGLKLVSFFIWEGMLDMVNCKVLFIVNFDYVDVYFFFEFSMFVFFYKFIFKICGIIILLLGLCCFFCIVVIDVGFFFYNVKILEDECVVVIFYCVFYSCKNFFFFDC